MVVDETDDNINEGIHIVDWEVSGCSSSCPHKAQCFCVYQKKKKGYGEVVLDFSK